MGTEKQKGFATRAIHAGQEPSKENGAVNIPIFLTSTFAQPSPGVLLDGHDYARCKNPTRTALEENIAALENAKHGLCFASGLAAIDAIIHLLAQNQHVILSDDVYGGTYRLISKLFRPLGIDYSIVDLSDKTALEQAIRPTTRLLLFETPTNPLLKIIDIAAICESLKKHKDILVCVDNTFASPYLQQPLAMGADIVVHSTTKYIGGHSDLIGGAIVTNSDELRDTLHFHQYAIGAVPSPFDCFLTLRATKTLAVRMEKHCTNAFKIAEHLSKHPKIEKVIYPGLESHPQHALAQRQMKHFGGMISLLLKGGLAESKAFLENVQIFTLAESLGGVESLVEHPAIMTHASLEANKRKELGILDNFLRISVGIEDCEDLIEDLDQALKMA